jgi:hypothetical protein
MQPNSNGSNNPVFMASSKKRKQTMSRPILSITLAFLIALTCISKPVAAHHSFAMFDQSQFMLIEGRITAWNYNNPHSWLHIEATDENGEIQLWSFEGASIVHAARQGVNGNTFRKGELIKVVMSPMRDGRQAGAMCIVKKEDGSIVRPNDGTCNAAGVIEQWQSSGWLKNGEYRDVHPAPVVPGG